MVMLSKLNSKFNWFKLFIENISPFWNDKTKTNKKKWIFIVDNLGIVEYK